VVGPICQKRRLQNASSHSTKIIPIGKMSTLLAAVRHVLLLCFSGLIARAASQELPAAVIESENVLLGHLSQIDEQRKVRVCMCIGNHMTIKQGSSKNLAYLATQLKILNSFVGDKFDLHVAVHSTVDIRYLFEGAEFTWEVLPRPLSIGFKMAYEHTYYFATNVDKHDVFAYWENDQFFTIEHLEAFIRAWAPLRATDFLPGFARFEVNRQTGRLFAGFNTEHKLPPTMIIDGREYYHGSLMYSAGHLGGY
jgi:hypothetical protein